MSITKVPSLPAVTDKNLADALRSVKNLLDVREGRTGDPLDSNVTYRDLVETGMAIVANGGTNGGNIIMPPWADPDGYDPTQDFTTPPKPNNLSATGAMTSIILKWDKATYRNHAYAEIWRGNTNVIGNALLLGTSDSSFYSDAVGSAFSGYYWVRFVSLANIKGPFNSTDGTVGQTSPDPEYLLEQLTGSITQSQLYTDLSDRINLIDGPATLTNSVAAKVAAEALARGNAIALETTNRTSALAAESSARVSSITSESNARASAIAAEASARVAAISASASTEASARETLAAQLRGNYSGSDVNSVTTGLIYSERQARVTADSALSTRIESLVAASSGDFANFYAVLSEEQSARISGDTANANSVNVLQSRVDNLKNKSGVATGKSLEATIVDNKQAQVDADSALSASVSSLSATVNSNNSTLSSSIASEAATRATADSANASNISGVTARLDDLKNKTGVATGKSIEATVVDNKQAQVDGDSALASSLSSLSSTVSSNLNTVNAAIASEASTRASAVSATASDISSIQSRLNNVKDKSGVVTNKSIEATLVDNKQAQVDADSAITSSVAALVATVQNNLNTVNSAITSEATTRANADTAEATARTALAARVTTVEGSAASNSSAITTEAATRASADSALATSISTLQSSVTNNNSTQSAAIQTEATTRANADSALSNSITTLQSTVTSNNTTQVAAIQLEASTRASETSGLSAQYTIKVDLSGFVSGFGLASTTSGANPSSDFGIRADKFWVAPPSYVSATAPSSNLYTGMTWRDTSVTPNVNRYYTGSAWSVTPQNLPFVLQTSPTTINGVNVPAGLYVQSAYIQNGSISNAKIGNLAVDDAKISSLDAVKINTGFLDAARIQAGSIDAKIANLDAAIITQGTINQARIGAASISSAKIADAAITSAKIADASVVDAKIVSLNAGKISAGYLDAARIAAGSITADRINSNGLLIKDVYGNVILGSGTALNPDYAASGTRNSDLIPSISNAALTADWNNVSGAGRPQDYATYGATFGSNVFGQIDSNSIWTYIANGAIQNAQIGNAAISSAKIGDLEVDTIKIRGNAVTESGVISNGGTVGFYSPQGFSVCLTAFNPGNYANRNSVLVIVADGAWEVGQVIGGDFPYGEEYRHYAATSIFYVNFGPGVHYVGFYMSDGYLLGEPRLLYQVFKK